MQKERTMTIIMFQEDKWWNAQCLEYDIASQGKTIEEAQYEFQRMFCGRFLVARELGIDDPLDSIPRAPDALYEMAKSTSKVFKLEFKLVDKLCKNVPPKYTLPSEALLCCIKDYHYFFPSSE
jgi:hypothetical protein